MNAERGEFFTHNKERCILTAVVDRYHACDDNHYMDRSNLKIKYNKDSSVISYVARNGYFLNVKDAYNDPRFSQEVDEKTGFVARSVMSMPIYDSEEIVGKKIIKLGRP